MQLKTKDWAKEESKTESNPIRYWNILNNTQISNLVHNLPINKTEFEQVSTLGRSKNKKYGKLIVEAIREFLKDKGLWMKFEEERRLTQEWSPDVESTKKKAKVASESRVGASTPPGSSGSVRRTLGVRDGIENGIVFSGSSPGGAGGGRSQGNAAAAGGGGASSFFARGKAGPLCDAGETNNNNAARNSDGTLSSSSSSPMSKDTAAAVEKGRIAIDNPYGSANARRIFGKAKNVYNPYKK